MAPKLETVPDYERQMAPKLETLPAYERQRLDNIRRNEEMMSALMIKRKAADLSAALRPNHGLKKPRPSPKPPSSPIVIRRSPRTRDTPLNSTADLEPRKRGPLLIREAFIHGPHGSDSGLLAAISSSSTRRRPVKGTGFDPRSGLVLRPENVANVVRGKMTSFRFLPFVDRTVVAVGTKKGNLGFWDVGSAEGDGTGIFVYQPHSADVSGISFDSFSPIKIFTSSYDGFVRLMDVEKESFNMIVASDCKFTSISQRPTNVSSVYVGEGYGLLQVWDARQKTASSLWELHDASISTIDFSTENTHLMATSSTDGFAHIWDLRMMMKDKQESIKSIEHEGAAHAAYFSPSGKCLATTSDNGTIRIANGANFADLSTTLHHNRIGKWRSASVRCNAHRAIWGWDDSSLYIGSTEQEIDVISPSDGTILSLASEEMKSIPGRLEAHPYILGSLAAAARDGNVFVWTMEQNSGK